MSSHLFTPKPLSAALPSSLSPVFSSASPPSIVFLSLSFPLQRRRRCRLKLVRAQDSDAGDTQPPKGSSPKSRRDILLEYVKNVQPEFMELFVKRAPKQVVDAMRQTVANMIGTLPPQFFSVTVTTVAENLAQLMYSVMMTGYMFRNAQYRLELQQSLDQIALPEPKDNLDVSDYAPGTQKKVTGEVITWNKITGPEKMDAIKYIEFLESEVEELKRQVTRRSANGHNELLDYLKSLEPQNLKDLTNSAGEDVVFAMNAFVKRLLAVSDPTQMKIAVTQTTAPELANLLYWLMVVGYSIRNIEVRFDMERVLDSPPKLAELPPGKISENLGEKSLKVDILCYPLNYVCTPGRKEAYIVLACRRQQLRKSCISFCRVLMEGIQ